MFIRVRVIRYSFRLSDVWKLQLKVRAVRLTYRPSWIIYVLPFWTLNSPCFSDRVWLCVPNSAHNKHEIYLYVIIRDLFSNAITMRFCELDIRSGSTCEIFRNIVSFYGEELIAFLQTPKLEGYPFSALCYCSFNIFAGTLRIWKPSDCLQPADAPCSSDTEEPTCQFYQLHTKLFPTSCCQG